MKSDAIDHCRVYGDLINLMVKLSFCELQTLVRIPLIPAVQLIVNPYWFEMPFHDMQYDIFLALDKLQTGQTA